MVTGRLNRWPDWVLQSKSVRFEISFSLTGFGHSGLNSDDQMPWHFETEQDWAAAVFEITPELYLDWKEWTESRCQCRAYTKKGTRCKAQTNTYERPHEFDPDKTPYCTTHKDPAKRGVPKSAKLSPKGAGSRSGFIYLLHAEETPRYKIGLSIQPKQRRATINNQSPFPVYVVDCYPVDDMPTAETYWHQRFESVRVHGEWFVLKPNQVAEFTQAAGGEVSA